MEDRRKKDDLKAIIKEANREIIREWLDDTWRVVGKWTVIGLGAFLFSLFAHIWISMHAEELKVATSKAIEQLSK